MALPKLITHSASAHSMVSPTHYNRENTTLSILLLNNMALTTFILKITTENSRRRGDGEPENTRNQHAQYYHRNAKSSDIWHRIGYFMEFPNNSSAHPMDVPIAGKPVLIALRGCDDGGLTPGPPEWVQRFRAINQSLGKIGEPVFFAQRGRLD